MSNDKLAEALRLQIKRWRGSWRRDCNNDECAILDSCALEIEGLLQAHAAEATQALDKLRACVLRCDPSLDPRVATICADLLRLADENNRTRGILETLVVEGHRRAERAEAELAALKARIEKATIGTLGVCFNGHEPAFVGFPDRFEHDSGQDLIGCRVALVKVDDEPTGEHADSIEAWAARKVGD